MPNSENTITGAFVNVLRYMREAWSVNEQITPLSFSFTFFAKWHILLNSIREMFIT